MRVLLIISLFVFSCKKDTIRVSNEIIMEGSVYGTRYEIEYLPMSNNSVVEYHFQTVQKIDSNKIGK